MGAWLGDADWDADQIPWKHFLEAQELLNSNPHQ